MTAALTNARRCHPSVFGSVCRTNVPLSTHCHCERTNLANAFAHSMSMSVVSEGTFGTKEAAHALAGARVGYAVVLLVGVQSGSPARGVRREHHGPDPWHTSIRATLARTLVQYAVLTHASFFWCSHHSNPSTASLLLHRSPLTHSPATAPNCHPMSMALPLRFALLLLLVPRLLVLLLARGLRLLQRRRWRLPAVAAPTVAAPTTEGPGSIGGESRGAGESAPALLVSPLPPAHPSAPVGSTDLRVAAKTLNLASCQPPAAADVADDEVAAIRYACGGGLLDNTATWVEGVPIPSKPPRPGAPPRTGHQEAAGNTLARSTLPPPGEPNNTHNKRQPSDGVPAAGAPVPSGAMKQGGAKELPLEDPATEENKRASPGGAVSEPPLELDKRGGKRGTPPALRRVLPETPLPLGDRKPTSVATATQTRAASKARRPFALGTGRRRWRAAGTAVPQTRGIGRAEDGWSEQKYNGDWADSGGRGTLQKQQHDQQQQRQQQQHLEVRTPPSASSSRNVHFARPTRDGAQSMAGMRVLLATLASLLLFSRCPLWGRGRGRGRSRCWSRPRSRNPVRAPRRSRWDIIVCALLTFVLHIGSIAAFGYGGASCSGSGYSSSEGSWSWRCGSSCDGVSVGDGGWRVGSCCDGTNCCYPSTTKFACAAAVSFVATCGVISEGGGAFASCASGRVYDATKATATTPNDAKCCKGGVSACKAGQYINGVCIDCMPGK